LEEIDKNGYNLVRKLITCPICRKNRQAALLKERPELATSDKANRYSDALGQYYRDSDHVTQFDLVTCALAVTNFQAIFCDKHPDDHVHLDLVVPDLTLTDLPAHFVIDPRKFVFVPSAATRLGEGGAGGVYRGEYEGKQVAVKQFHSTTKAK